MWRTCRPISYVFHEINFKKSPETIPGYWLRPSHQPRSYHGGTAPIWESGGASENILWDVAIPRHSDTGRQHTRPDKLEQGIHWHKNWTLNKSACCLRSGFVEGWALFARKGEIYKRVSGNQFGKWIVF